MNKKSKWIYIVLFTLLIGILGSGCKTVPQLSPMQKRQLTTRVINGNHKMVFKSVMTVLQDNEYIIKEAKMDSGLITAEVNRESDFFTQLFTYSKYSGSSNKGTIVEVSAIVNELNASASEVRITIQEKVYSSSGGTTSSKQIYDQKIYKALFDSIIVEVKRKEAMQ